MHILKNKLLLQKHWKLQEWAIDNWPYWLLEENIKVVNELSEEEDSSRKKQEGEQAKGMPNYDGMMKNMNMNMPNFSIPKF
jgi:hypothetical protein